MKTRFSIILLAAVVLLLTVEGCSTIKTPIPATSAVVTSSDIPYPWPPGYTQTNGPQVSSPFSFIPYSLTNVIYPTAYTSGFYIYALTIGKAGDTSPTQPPFEISFPSNNLLLFNGELR